ncbi:hypothetical protein K2P96_01325 [Patescibacteria group bacterium]|nr:hypothetical protein [Patescibacteria group bacterium]
MDPESKKLLEDTARLAQENNQILHSMRRSMRWARVMSLLYWVFIIGSAVGAYYFIQPYLDQVIKLYDGASTTLKGFNVKQ